MDAGDYQAGDVLGGKYTVVETLGRGSRGVPYKVSLSYSAAESIDVVHLGIAQVCMHAHAHAANDAALNIAWLEGQHVRKQE